jgi:hypothetical protein
MSATWVPPQRVPNGFTLLDVCCKSGGASYGYYLAGFDVVGVDREPQPHYPFPFIQADLRDLDPEWIAQNFDASAWSPPCWAHSDLKHRTGLEYEDFIPEARELAVASGLPYVMENVEGAPLLDPLVLCGTQFEGLRVTRHRARSSAGIPLEGTALPSPRPGALHHLHRPFCGRMADRSSVMPVSRFPDDLVTAGLLVALLVVLIVAGVGTWWALRKENQEPTSYTRLGVPVDLPGEGPSPEQWAAMSTEEQEEFDNAALDEVEQAEIDAAADAQDFASSLRTGSGSTPCTARKTPAEGRPFPSPSSGGETAGCGSLCVGRRGFHRGGCRLRGLPGAAAAPGVGAGAVGGCVGAVDGRLRVPGSGRVPGPYRPGCG